MRKSLFLFLIFCGGHALSQDRLTELNPILFNPDFSNYDQATALFCAQISDVAYDKEEKIMELVSSLNIQYPMAHYRGSVITDHSSKTRTQVLLFGTPYYLIVAFRGTEPSVITDWITDGKFWKYTNTPENNEALGRLPPGHGGFRTAVMRLITQKNILKAIKDFVKESNPAADISTFPIYLTGHSLGAALAQLFVVPLRNNQLHFSGMYNFAPPLAVGDEVTDTMRLTFGYSTYDIVNYKDYVPRAGRYGVKHFGKFYRICDNNLLYKEEEAYVKFGMFERFKEFNMHSIKSYMSGLRDERNIGSLVSARSVNNCSCFNPSGEVEH